MSRKVVGIAVGDTILPAGHVNPRDLGWSEGVTIPPLITWLVPTSIFWLFMLCIYECREIAGIIGGATILPAGHVNPWYLGWSEGATILPLFTWPEIPTIWIFTHGTCTSKMVSVEPYCVYTLLSNCILWTLFIVVEDFVIAFTYITCVTLILKLYMFEEKRLLISERNKCRANCKPV